MKKALIALLLLLGALTYGAMEALAGDISVSVQDSNNTTINLSTQSDTVANYGANDTTGEDQCPAQEVPSVVGGVLNLPQVDVYDMEHGVWLRYKARVFFDGGGCVSDLDLTPLGLAE